jgi:hypothetical protein
MIVKARSVPFVVRGCWFVVSGGLGLSIPFRELGSSEHTFGPLMNADERG